MKNKEFENKWNSYDRDDESTYPFCDVWAWDGERVFMAEWLFIVDTDVFGKSPGEKRKGLGYKDWTECYCEYPGITHWRYFDIPNPPEDL